MGHCLHIRLGEEQVERLRLVDPFLATGRGRDKGLVRNIEGRLVELLDPVGDTLHVFELAIEILQVIDHLLPPESFLLQVTDQVLVQNDKIP